MTNIVTGRNWPSYIPYSADTQVGTHTNAPVHTHICMCIHHAQTGGHAHTQDHTHAGMHTHAHTHTAAHGTHGHAQTSHRRAHAPTYMHLLHFQRWLLENVSFPRSDGRSSPTAVLTRGRRSWGNRPCLSSQAAGAGASLTPLWGPSAHLAPSVGVSGPTSTGRLRPSCLARPAQPLGWGLPSALSPLPTPSPAWSCNVGTSVVDLSELSLQFSA